MKTLTRVLKYLVLTVIAVVVVALVVLVGANLSDETLSADAEKMLQARPARVDDKDNGYYVFLGMFAAPDANAYEFGRKLQAAYDRLFQEDPARSNFEVPGMAPAADMSADKGFSKVRCAMQGANCVAGYIEKADLVRAQLKAHAVLLARNTQIIGMSGFEDKLLPSISAPLPSYQGMVRASELQLAAAALDINEGREEAGLTVIAGLINHHRKLLSGTSALLSRMVGLSLLRKDYQVLSELIELKPALAQSQAALLKPLLQPLSESENDMRAPLANEARTTAMVLRNLQKSGTGAEAMGGLGEKWATRFAYLPNATLNSQVPYWNGVSELAHGSAATYLARRQQFADSPAGKPVDANPDFTYVRNPVGKILINIARPDVLPYIERTHDMDGYIRLVSLQAALRREQVAVAAIADFVTKAGADMRNPYDGAPMRWDAATSSLVFTGRQRASSNPVKEPTTYRVTLAAS